MSCAPSWHTHAAWQLRLLMMCSSLAAVSIHGRFHYSLTKFTSSQLCATCLVSLQVVLPMQLTPPLQMVLPMQLPPPLQLLVLHLRPAPVLHLSQLAHLLATAGGCIGITTGAERMIIPR